jgi:exopolyphosphatase / guanosine-5'-triphosphate,3'-diphosphate pyrophosphatase
MFQIMENRIAIVDMGTNTFHLLIAEKRGGTLITIYQDRVATKIGMGGIDDGVVTKAGIERAIVALKEFDKKANGFGVTQFIAIGTSAIRNAKNKEELLNRIHIETSFKTTVISGEEEADLIYQGVREAISIPSSKALIIDIGGGSVEFIIGNKNQFFWKRSFEIGGQRLMERFQHHDPILTSEIEQINQFLEDELHPLVKALAEFKPTLLIGSSGSFDTLSEIYCAQNHIPYTSEPETPLTMIAFKVICNDLLPKNRSERMNIPGMIELRVDMIVVACCIVEFITSKFTFEELRVSSYSLKEGVLASINKN